MTNPLVSVIVPVYNSEEHLERCVQSILSQTRKNLEIILVDDGSSDKSIEIEDRYSQIDSRIKPLYLEHNGVLFARISGVTKATGSWIAFADADDYIDHHMYEKLIRNAEEHSADISVCGIRTIGSDNIIRDNVTVQNLCVKNRREGLYALLRHIDNRLLMSSSCNKLYRRDLFSDSICRQLKQKRISCNEDYLMNWFVFYNAEMSVYDPDCFYNYDLRNNSSTHSRPASSFTDDALAVAEMIKDNADDEILPLAMHSYLLTLLECYSIMYKRCVSEEKLSDIRYKLSSNEHHLHLLSEEQMETARLIIESPDIFAKVLDARRNTIS